MFNLFNKRKNKEAVKSAPKENIFIPLSWPEKRIENFWKNNETGIPKDENVVSGNFNADLYLKFKDLANTQPL